MNTRDRLKAYSGQTKTARMTPRQRRRASHKERRVLRFYRQRWVTDINAYPEWVGTERNEF